MLYNKLKRHTTQDSNRKVVVDGLINNISTLRCLGTSVHDIKNEKCNSEA